MNRQELYKKVIEYFEDNMPDAKSELNYENPYQLTVAVILSAQCTDKRVNLITPEFFKIFPDIYSLSKSSNNEIFDIIKSCSYPNNKAKHLLSMAKMVVDKFKGDIPNSAKELIQLPGIGRKTANVIISVAFNTPAMAVDTHVQRVAKRIGLTINAKTPEKTEQQLVKYFPKKKLSIAHHWLILHGRYICKARKPLCEECGLNKFCLNFQKN